MGSFGALFPGNKLRKENDENKGTGQGFQPGPLDLDSGVVYLTPRPDTKDEITDDASGETAVGPESVD